MYNEVGIGIGDGKLRPNGLDERITILEETNVKQKIWEEITAKGIDDTVNNFNGKTSVDTTIWDSSPYNAEAKKVDTGGNYTGEDIFTASGTHIKAVIDSNGDYILSGTPDPILYPRYSIVYVRKGTSKEFGEEKIPSSQILAVIETIAMVRDVVNGEVRPRNDGDNLNMKSGGFKDNYVINIVPLGSADDPELQTLKKNILGAINEANLRILSALGSGKWSGLVISKSGTNKFNVGSGVYVIVDNYTDQNNPTFTFYLFAGQNDITPTYLTFANATFVGMNASGVYQSPLLITPEQKKTIIPIGTLLHTDQTTIQETSSTGIVLPSIGLEFIDFLNVLGPRFNEKGNDFKANGTNVKIFKSEGVMIGTGVNYDNSFKEPHRKVLPEKSIVSFLRVKRGVSIAGTVPSTDIDTAKYDPNGDGTLIDIPKDEFVAHRIMIVPEFGVDGLTLIQYGQKSYDTMKNALDSFQKEEFEKIVEAENIHIRGVVIVKQGATDLSNRIQANFVNFGRLGEVNFTRNPRYAETSSAVPVISGMSDQRQVISFVDSGGNLYADIGRYCDLKRNDISFIASDSSINTSGGDFTECNPQVGDRIIVYDSINNNGIFTISSVSATKIVVNETIIDESAGSYIYIEFAGNGDITFNFKGWKYKLDCTNGSGVGGRARIQLTAGTDTSPQENWIFTIPSGEDAILQQSLTEPDLEDYPDGFSIICSIFVPSTTETISVGSYNSRRWTDTKIVSGRGTIPTLLSKLRDRTDYKSGLGANITINTTPTPDNVDFVVSAGVIREIYKQRINSLQLSVDSALIVNAPTIPYRKITDISSILVDATGSSLNNKYFQLIVAISLNTDGYPDRLLINLPNGSYTNPLDAFNDINNYSITTFPTGFKSVYLLFAGVFRLVGGNSWTNVALTYGLNNIDLRGQPLGVRSSGSGTSAVQEFSDVNFGVYDDGDNTKILRFQCAGITTGTTRIWTVPDRDIDFGNPTFDSVKVDNMTIGLDKISMSDGNNLTIDLIKSTGNSVLNILNSNASYDCNVIVGGFVRGKNFIDLTGTDDLRFTAGSWSWGQDKSDSEAWVLSRATTLGSSNFIKCEDDANGNIFFSPLGTGNVQQTNGLFRNLNQSYFQAYVSSPPTNITGDGTVYTIIYNTENYDRNGDYNNTTGIYTAKVDGIHPLKGGARIDGMTSSHIRFFIRITTSKGNVFGGEVNPYAVRQQQGTNTLHLGVAFDFYLDAGDTAKIDIMVAGGTKVISINGSVLDYNQFTGRLAC